MLYDVELLVGYVLCPCLRFGGRLTHGVGGATHLHSMTLLEPGRALGHFQGGNL